MTPECRETRKHILNIAHKSGHGHIPTCFSVVEVMHAVYSTMNHNPQNPKWDRRDIFILSKGHAALGLYCVLARHGYFDIKDVETFGACGARFGCHTDRKRLPGVEASTGSLGHGIGLAVGMALAFKIKKSMQRVYVLIGDGESNEGSVWEAIMVAANLSLNNLTIIYDDNRSHGRGLQIPNPTQRLEAFGCSVEKIDGHDIDALKSAFQTQNNNVRAVVANTEKGYGCKLLIDNHYEWHRKSPDEKQLEILMKELNEKTV